MADFPSTNAAITTPATDDETGVTCRVVGIVRGREIDAPATVSLTGSALLLTWSTANAWRLSLDGLDGVAFQPSSMTLYLNGGDVLELQDNTALRALALRVIDRACTIPELTRGLRALGSERGAPGPAHDRWFAPLLAARRAVAGLSDADRQVALIDARQISLVMQRTLSELAVEQAPDNPAMQRALEAALHEEGEPAFMALERLALAGAALQGSAPDTRLVEWRNWLQMLRGAFAAADDCWARCANVLSEGV